MTQRDKRGKRTAPGALLDLEAAGAILGLTAHRLAVRVRNGQVPRQVIVRLGKRIFIAKPALDLWLTGRLNDRDLTGKGASRILS